MKTLRCLPFVLSITLVTPIGCDNTQSIHPIDPGLERMLRQPRVDPYEGSDFYTDGRAMREPPAGTVPRDRSLGPAVLRYGVEKGAYALQIPIPVTRAMLALGRERFEAICAACHGILGDGQSAVAEDMQLRRPPSLIALPIRDYPPGRIFETASQGYGLMPSYADLLPLEERWAVVAYLRALQLSQHARIDTLPTEIQTRLRSELR